MTLVDDSDVNLAVAELLGIPNPEIRFGVWGLRLRFLVWGFVFRVHNFAVRVSSSGVRNSGFGIRDSVR